MKKYDTKDLDPKTHLRTLIYTKPSKTHNTSRHYGISTFAFALMIGSILVLSQVQAAQSFRPEASQAFVQALTDNKGGQENALISVTYDLDQWHTNGHKPPKLQKVVIGEQKVILRDDGRAGDKKPADGIYSAFVEFDFKTLFTKRERIEALKSERGKIILPRFKNRQLIGHEKIMLPNDPFPVIQPVEGEELQSKKPSGKIIPGTRKPVSVTLDDTPEFSDRPIMLEKELSIAIQLGKPIPIFPIGISTAIDTKKSLLIHDLAVVEDPSRTFNVCTGSGNPNGVWTFKHLVTEMANNEQTRVTPEEFVRMWLSQWETSQNVNGWTVDERNAGIRSKIIDSWERDSGGPDRPLNLDIAPFQLMAIVNRVDLRGNPAYGGDSAGEGRFVFRVMDIDQGCAPMQFTVIFEYGIEQQSCSAVQNWGQRWADLSDMVLGSPAYNTALESITESFVQASTEPFEPNNGSALNQLRTNEIALASPWELREFVISDAGWDKHLLKPNTVALTPDNSLNNTSVMNDFFASVSNDFFAFGSPPDVPLRFPTMADPFRGGASTIPSMPSTPDLSTPDFFWNAPGFPTTLREAELRHVFSLNTCNGCHAGETGTNFTHIKPGGSLPASLSGFLTGIDVVDPAPPPNTTITRRFKDLERRATDLDALINSSCLAQMVRPVLKAPH